MTLKKKKRCLEPPEQISTSKDHVPQERISERSKQEGQATIHDRSYEMKNRYSWKHQKNEKALNTFNFVTESRTL